MRRDDVSALGELYAQESEDPVIAVSAEGTRTVLSSISSPAEAQSVKLVVADFSTASQELLNSSYYTPVASSFPRQSLIVVNADALREISFTVRAFEPYGTLQDLPYLADDRLMFELAKTVRELTRRQASAQEMPVESTVLETTCTKQVELALTFFVGHELGHIFEGAKGGNYRSMPGIEVPVEERIELAITKLGRHVDDLAQHGFDLSLWEKIIEPSSFMRSPERRYAQNLDYEYTNQSLWFASEEKADVWAQDILRGSLEAVATDNPLKAHYERYLMCKALFAFAMFSWYRDLLEFGERLQWDEPPTANVLMARLAFNRQDYISLASLFGEYHRFPLLRTNLAMKSLFERMTGALWVSPEERRVTYTGSWPPETLTDQKAWFCSESLRRFWLLANLMDTPIKIATGGTIMAWYREEIQANNMEQILFMNYEDIHEALARVLSMKLG
jgi:hypothetical protein